MFFNKKNQPNNHQDNDINQVKLPSQAYIIAEVIKGCRFKNYLELGIYYGATYNYIKQFVERAVGVDIEHKDFIPEDKFFCMTTDEFFAQNQEKFDAVFIDAAHEYEQVRKDFDNAMRILNKGGVVFLHDTDPYSKEYMGETFCNDAYKMNDYIANQGIYNFITIPMDETGLSMVMKKDDCRYKEFLQ